MWQLGAMFYITLDFFFFFYPKSNFFGGGDIAVSLARMLALLADSSWPSGLIFRQAPVEPPWLDVRALCAPWHPSLIIPRVPRAGVLPGSWQSSLLWKHTECKLPQKGCLGVQLSSTSSLGVKETGMFGCWRCTWLSGTHGPSAVMSEGSFLGGSWKDILFRAGLRV